MADKVFFVGPWERVLYLRTVPALRGLDSGELVRVAQFARERFHPKGALLFEKGKRAEAFHVVVEGRVRVRRSSRPAQTIGPREVVGFLHLLAGGSGGLQAEAETETLTLEFDADIQWDLCEERFPILLNYARFLSRSLIAAEELAAEPPAIPSRRPASPPDRDVPALVERILALRHSDVFGGCSLDALGELARHLSDVRFPAGAKAWEAGERSDWFLLVLFGGFGQSAENAVGPGQVAGMEEALAGEPRRRGLPALQDSRALRVEAEPFLDILEDHFETAMALLSGMASRLLGLQERAARTAPDSMVGPGAGA